MSKIQLKANIEQMGSVLASLAAYQQQIQRTFAEETAREEGLQRKKTQLREKLNHFKNHFQCFAKECSSEWGSVYREFLLIINYVVELYQIRVAKLEVLNESQQRQIENLLLEKSSYFEQATQLQESSLQSKDISFSIKEDLSHCKKVKISDVIASYQSSVLTPEASLSNSQLDNDNEDYFSTCFERRGKTTNYRDELAFLGSGSRLDRDPVRDGRRKKALHQEKQNMGSFRQFSQLVASKRGRNSLGNRESTEPSPCSKLTVLRKQLISNKKI